jgi:Coenzyme PQQ synthesis protein D (PqqD)
MTPLLRTTVLARQQGTEAAAFGAELAILDAPAQQLTAVNPTGARLWKLLDGHRSVAALVRCLAEEFDAPEAQIEADAIAFLAALHGEGLLRMVSP